MANNISVCSVFDHEAGVWTVTSDDVPGLVLEDESIDRILDRLPGAIEDMLEARGVSWDQSFNLQAHISCSRLDGRRKHGV